MKYVINLVLVFFSTLAILVGADRFITKLDTVAAQGPTYGAFSIGNIAPTVAQCPLNPLNNLPGAPGQLVVCPVGSAASFSLYVSANQGPWVLWPSVQTPGVTSWNKLKGAVTYAPTKVSCTTATLAKGVFTGTGCTVSQ